MRIDALDLYHVAVPLVRPWRTAYGEDAVVESVLVRMTSGGAVGWGESCPLAAPCYSPEWAGGVFACARDWLAPAVVGQWIESGDELQQRLAHFKGNPFAKAALDTAWWVLAAERAGRPLYQYLGATRERAAVGADFGVLDSIDELLAAVGRAVAAGFPRIKLKFRPGWDLTMLRAVRQEFPTQTIHIDCNAAYTIEHSDLFCRLDDFHLAMIEQPLAADDLVDHARLQSILRTPICLDESITSLARAETALDLGSCRYVNIKPGRVGGVTVARQIHDLCREREVPCWIGGMLETAVGVRICAALAMLDGCTYPADIFASSTYYADDLGRPAVELTRLADGTPAIEPLAAPGIGTAPDLGRLAQYVRGEAHLQA
ncbi:MAG: o-succinylbenzoate synthase [Pirellulales bacterium]|nr:o-succinylbenzoate synthase [Pirellulales bacterium]